MRRTDLLPALSLSLTLAWCGCRPPLLSPPEPTLGLTREHDLLSHRGAHAYLAFDDPTLGPRLFWRQHGDLWSHFGRLTPLLDPLYAVERDGQSCAATATTWQGAWVERTLDCGVTEIVGFADATTILAWLAPDEAGGAFGVVGGAPAEDLEARTELGEEGLTIELGGDLTNLWSDPTPTTWSVAVDASPPVCPAGREGGWRLTWDEAPAQLSLRFGLEGVGGAVEPGETLTALELTQARLEAWLAQAPADLQRDPSAAMAWTVLWSNAAAPLGHWTRETIVPSKRWYFRGAWLWDAAFHAIALADGGEDARALGRDQVRLFLDHATPAGALPREIWVDSINPGIQPPGVMSWAALALADAGEGDDFLAEVYAPLAANHTWFLQERDADGDGLGTWEGTDSGWDTSPRWDDGEVEAVDLACWLYLDALLLADMAERLGDTAAAGTWRAEADASAARIRSAFWDEEDSFFYDLDPDSDAFVRVMTPATFVPLFVGVATQEQAEATAAWLDDPAVFATPWPLPTVAAGDPRFDPQDYWRGPTWMVTNFIAIRGLERYGLDAQAAELRDRTLAMVAAQPTPREYYDATTGEGLGAPDFGWSGAFTTLLLREGWGEVW